MTVGTSSLHNLELGLGLEWLDTNGLGGFASSTLIGCNTRRYHGLLVAAPRGPGARIVLLSKLEDRLEIGAQRHELSTNLYGDTLHPHGYRYLQGFCNEPWPTWSFRVGEWQLTRELALIHGRNVAVVRYTLNAGPHPVWLVARPLLAGRDYHHLSRASSDVPACMSVSEQFMDVTIHGPTTRCLMRFPQAEAIPDGLWYYNFRYTLEQERGLDYLEDLYSPGEIRWLIAPGQSVWLVVSDGTEIDDPERALSAEADHRAGVVATLPEADSVGRRLVRAADQFVARRPLGDRSLTTIVAGYPWFTDWGRDTLIALPGLLISTGRLDEAAEVLELHANSLNGGLVPNRFLDDGQGASYNAVDATLWLFAAARLYAYAGGTQFAVDKLYPALSESISALSAGTHFDIHEDEDGLLWAGNASTQLTWMDAQVHGKPVTPRWGKPVEVEALWFSALRTMEYLAGKAGDDEAAHRFGAKARRARAAFEQTFWCPERGYLADCVNTDGVDEALRPNQVLALSLPYKLVSDDVAEAVLAAVESQLLTPYGLRTLAPGSPGYCPVYAGGPEQRDRAYHQGTVWPWLLGPYVSARLSLLGRSDEARRWARNLLAPLIQHLDEACVDQISEIFDAEPPQRPRGCFAQAWSVAEVLRLWLDYNLEEIG